MRLHSYLDSATAILSLYKGELPFTLWLKDYFKKNRKYGSGDRKFISNLCYCYFRLGTAFKEYDMNERLLIGQFLCSSSSNLFLSLLKRTWNEKIQLPLTEKLHIVGGWNEHVFPFHEELSDQIDKEAFDRSFLVQPDLFLRIRPGQKNDVLRKLKQGSILFDEAGENCLALPNGTKVEEVLEPDREVVVQDYSSQQVFKPLLPLLTNKGKIKAWDCCAASGGKSILLSDLVPQVHVTVSDIRRSIIMNLEKRFGRAGLRNYNSFISDVASSTFILDESFDLVICDAPCSGSGTWSRTPEQMSFFKAEKIDHYTTLQKTIALNAWKTVKHGGYFLYITCSVFKKENEEVVAHLQEQTTMELISQEYLKGYNQKADTLFVALFRLR
ncbi:MAG: Fmu (Sun) domain-containing protein [Candidatus Dadabacteria bacterium]